jgi:dolichol kinase
VTTERDRRSTWTEFVTSPSGTIAAFVAVLAVPVVALGPSTPPLFLFGQFMLAMIALSAVAVLSSRDSTPEMARVRSREPR